MRTGLAFKEKLRAGRRAIGIWHVVPEPIITEVIATSGVDAVIIDQEHGPVDMQGVARATIVLQAHGVAAFVRVPWNDPVHIKRVLDIGIDGLMIPNVQTAEEAAAAVAACRYPPAGIRGMALGGARAGNYGRETDRYLATIDDALTIMVQIEAVAAIDHVPAIAAVPGIDMLFIGPQDLSASAGRPRDFTDANVLAQLARAEQAVRGTDAWLGSILSLGRTPAEMFDAGYHFICTGSDLTFVRDGAAAVIDSSGLSRRRGERR